MGARTRSTHALYNREKGGRANRAKFPGARDLATSPIPSIAKGIYEEEEPIYKLKETNEEQKLFQVNESLDHLIKSLEDKKDIITEQNDEN